MDANLHEMFGLPDKPGDHRAQLIAATEHLRSEVKDVFRELGLQEDDPCQRRLTDACNAWVQAATELADAQTDHVERRVVRFRDQAVRRIRNELHAAAMETRHTLNQASRSRSLSLMLAVALFSGVAGFVGGLYYSIFTEALYARPSWDAVPQPARVLAPKS